LKYGVRRLDAAFDATVQVSVVKSGVVWMHSYGVRRLTPPSTSLVRDPALTVHPAAAPIRTKSGVSPSHSIGGAS